MYTVNENSGAVQVLLSLSNPSSTVVMVKVSTADRSANGKYHNAHHYASNINEFHLYNIRLDLVFQILALLYVKMTEICMLFLTCFIGGGTDYGSGPYTVMFPAETTNASFSVSINNDNIVEMNETFSLTINPFNDIMTVDPDSAVVTIVDDDSE